MHIKTNHSLGKGGVIKRWLLRNWLSLVTITYIVVATGFGLWSMWQLSLDLTSRAERIVAFKDIAMVVVQATSYLFLIIAAQIATKQFRHQKKVTLGDHLDQMIEMVERQLDRLDARWSVGCDAYETEEHSPSAAKWRMRFFRENAPELSALRSIVADCRSSLPKVHQNLALLHEVRLNLLEIRINTHFKRNAEVAASIRGSV